MKINEIKHSFRGLSIKGINPIDRIALPNIEQFENLTKSVDVFLKSTTHGFPFHNTLLETSAIKISARPKNLGFWERLFGLKTKTDYFPVGNCRDIIDFNHSFEEVLSNVISQVKK